MTRFIWNFQWPCQQHWHCRWSREKPQPPKRDIPKLSNFDRVWSKPAILEAVIAENLLLKTAYRQPGTKLTKKKQFQVFLFFFFWVQGKGKRSRGKEGGLRAGGAPNRQEGCLVELKAFFQSWKPFRDQWQNQQRLSINGAHRPPSTPPLPPYTFTSCPLAQEKKKD